MSFVESAREYWEKQKLARMQHEAAKERVVMHESIEKERKREAEEKKIEQIRGSLTDEEKRLLEAKKARDAERAAKSKAFWQKAYKMVEGSSHSTRRKKRSRSDYF
jgi:hypothetical protein